MVVGALQKKYIAKKCTTKKSFAKKSFAKKCTATVGTKHSARTFVQDQVGHASQICFSLFQKINHATGGTNANFNPLLQITNLWVFVGTAVDASVFDFGGKTKFIAFGFDLDRQFTGGCNDQYNWSIATFQMRLTWGKKERRKEGKKERRKEGKKENHISTQTHRAGRRGKGTQ